MTEEEEEANEAAGVLAQTLAKAGQPAEGEHVVRSIPASVVFSGWLHEKVVALVTIAAAFADQGQVQRALALAREAESLAGALGNGGTWQEPDVLTDIGTLMIRLGAEEEAESLWMKAAGLCRDRQDSDQECGKILAQIACQFADIGLWDRAAQVARSIRLERLRDRTTNEVRNRRRGNPGRGVPE